MSGDEPRVRLYGLLPVTYGRYLLQSAIEVVGLVALLVAWFWGWPILRDRLAFELPWAMAVVMAILAHVPWILLGLAIFKAVEFFLMLRAFRRKASVPPPSGSSSDGQAPLPPLPGPGPGGEGPHP